MLCRVGFRPAAFSACANVYAAAIPYSTLPSNGRFLRYWSCTFRNSATQLFAVSAGLGR